MMWQNFQNERALAGPTSSDAPPKVALALTLGVTGHRPDVLNGRGDPVEHRLVAVFDEIMAFVANTAVVHGALFDSAVPQFHLVSPLAEGADQIAASVALAKGFTLGATLPFARGTYEQDFAAGPPREAFHALVAQAQSVLELPGDRDASLAAYVMAGRATIAHCDLLIAIWDGEPPRGRGGTAEVVEIALLQGTPILHVPLDPDQPLRLLWSGLDPHVCTTRENCYAAAVPYSAEALNMVLDAILLPPASLRERSFIQDYYREHERKLNLRLEYPLLLALTGVVRVRRTNVRATPLPQALEGEWKAFRGACGQGHGIETDLDPLQRAYCWSDQLARHFAQTYRSGHIFNFLVGAAAVLTALAGLILPQGKLLLALAELTMIAAIIANTQIGVKHGWHRRWLDYRQLAERLRPMRSLKLLGVAAPRRDLNAKLDQRRWTEWYAAGMWRAMRSPAGVMRAPAQLAMALKEHELTPQIAYHRKAAQIAVELDHRLHLIGLALFAATVIGCLVLIVGYFIVPDWVSANAKIFVILSAGLPAVGTALFGIRVQGDFAGTAQRSLSTATRLQESVAAVSSVIELTRAADVFEEAARFMLTDLGEWKLSHEQRELVIPG